MISQESKNAASYSTAKKSQVPFRLGKGGKEKEEREKRKGREEKEERERGKEEGKEREIAPLWVLISVRSQRNHDC